MMKKYIFLFFVIVAAIPAMAQTYDAHVSRDSVGVLNAKVDMLKSSMKILDLKIEESKEEAEVEKLRLKLLEANGDAKSSYARNSNQADNTGSKSSIDLKAMEKLSKKAKNDADDAQKALERFNKQIAKVEDIRTQIQTEERKLGYKKPHIVYDYR